MNEETDTSIDAAPRWSSIAARGPDARAFLQGQLSQDLSTITPDGGWALLLAPDSVVISSLFVVPNADGYDLAVPRELGDAALLRLRRFLLRTNCTLELVELDEGPYHSAGDQIEHGMPGAREFARGLTPHSFGASFVASTVSFTKGCFTGQELVGRLDARGSSVPWRMVRASGPSEERINEVLMFKGPKGPSGLTTATHTGVSIVGIGFAHRSLLGSPELDLASDVQVEEIA
jgi:folate-binding protein YgfZ